MLFDDAADYRFFVDLLVDAVREHDVALHAYVLMPRQMRFLLTPPESSALPRLLQTLGRRYVPYLNRKLARSGPLWDRRYRSTLVDADALLLASVQRIETLPVVGRTRRRAGGLALVELCASRRLRAATGGDQRSPRLLGS